MPLATLLFFVLVWFASAVAFVGFWELQSRGPADGLLFGATALLLILAALAIGIPGGLS